jgi:hypothetical protein
MLRRLHDRRWGGRAAILPDGTFCVAWIHSRNAGSQQCGGMYRKPCTVNVQELTGEDWEKINRVAQTIH